jgi:uncharacterized membrane protein YkvA (DUF1232 family)
VSVLQAVLGAALALLVVWLALVAALLVVGRRHDPVAVREALRLLPDVVRLLRRLAGDAGLGRGVRVWLWLVLAYLLIPIDVIPDFLPLVGYADDVFVVVLALRGVLRRAGPDALARHWPGTPAGLLTLHRLLGIG